MTSYSS